MKSYQMALLAGIFCLFHYSPVALAQDDVAAALDLPVLTRVSLKEDAIDNKRDIRLELNPARTHQRSFISVFQLPDWIEINVDDVYISDSMQEDIRERQLNEWRKDAIPFWVVIHPRAGSLYLSMNTKEPTAYYITHDEQQLHILTQPAAPAQSRFISGAQKWPLTEALSRLINQQQEQFFVFAPQKDIGLWFANLPSQQVLDYLLRDYGMSQYKFGKFQIYAQPLVLGRIMPEFFQKTFKGEGISLSFSNVSVKNVIKILEDFTDKIFIIQQIDLGNFSVQVKDMPWPQVLTIITTARGLVVKEMGQVNIIAAPDVMTLANERGCFTSPAFEGFGLSHIELQYTGARELIPQLEEQVQARYKVSPACEMLELKPRFGGYGKTVNVTASAAATREIRHLIEELDQPGNMQKE